MASIVLDGRGGRPGVFGCSAVAWAPEAHASGRWPGRLPERRSSYFLVHTGLVATAVALSSRRARSTRSGTATSCWSAPGLLRQRLRRRAGGQPHQADGHRARSADIRSALSDLPQLQALHGAHRETSSGRSSRPRICTWRRSKRWRARSTPRINRRTRTSGASSSMRPGWRRPSASARRTFRASRRRRSCRTSASWPCPSTSCPSRGRSRRRSSRRFGVIRRSGAGDHRGRAVSVSRRADHLEPSRALGRRRLSARAQGRGDSARRAHPHDRRLLRRGHDGAALSQGVRRGRGDRPAQARGRVRRSIRGWSRRSSSCCRRSWRRAPRYEQNAPAANDRRPSPSGEPPPAPATDAPQSAFENIALAHREIYALYEIAQPMSTSLSAADTMALISSKLAKIVPWSGCSLFLRDPKTHTLEVRVRRRPRRAAAAQSDAVRRIQPGRVGGPHATAAGEFGSADHV